MVEGSLLCYYTMYSSSRHSWKEIHVFLMTGCRVLTNHCDLSTCVILMDLTYNKALTPVLLMLKFFKVFQGKDGKISQCRDFHIKSPISVNSSVILKSFVAAKLEEGKR